MKNKILLVLAVLAIIGGSIYYSRYTREQAKPTIEFAQCLKSKGVVFYGAFWCTHCQKQKKLFGVASSELPYVECSTPDGQGVTQICKDKHIEGYPTWEFASGTRRTGELSFDELSKESGCPAP